MNRKGPLVRLPCRTGRARIRPCNPSDPVGQKHTRMLQMAMRTHWRLRVVDLIHQGAEAQAVTEEDELILVLSALLADARQELDSRRPLGVRQLRFTRERVQVRDEGGDELERPRLLAEAFVEALYTARLCQRCDLVRDIETERTGR